MTMATLELIRRIYVEGATLELTAPGNLRVSGHPVPTDLRAGLKSAKPDVIQLLTAQGAGAIDPGYSGTRQYVMPPDCIAGNACRHLGPCSRFLMRHPCEPNEYLESSDLGKAA